MNATRRAARTERRNITLGLANQCARTQQVNRHLIGWFSIAAFALLAANIVQLIVRQ